MGNGKTNKLSQLGKRQRAPEASAAQGSAIKQFKQMNKRSTEQ